MPIPAALRLSRITMNLKHTESRPHLENVFTGGRQVSGVNKRKKGAVGRVGP